MAVAVEIRRQDMKDFLIGQGFSEITLFGTREMVMGKVVDKEQQLCLRVYTTIDGGVSRGVGEDAIRCVLVTRVDGEVKIIGSDVRVHRVVGWRQNLLERLNRWREQLGPACPKCGAVTVQRLSGRGPFWGCCRYPVCRTVQPVVPARHTPQPVAAIKPRAPERQREPVRRQEVPQSSMHYHEQMAMKSAFQHYEIEQERRAYSEKMRRDEWLEIEAELEANGIYDHD